MKRFFKYLSFALILFTGTAPIHVPAADDMVTASWQSHQLKFRYAGFTTDYSCAGIRGKLKSLLRTLGARDDVRISGGCLGKASEVQPTHNLKLAFSMPVPADERELSENVFGARWQEVRIGDNRPRGFDGGDCELVEQFAKQVLPSLEPREVHNDTRCVPHQRSPGAIDLKATVLVQQVESELEPETRD